MHTKTIQKGSILVARPSLLTDVFQRSVVLITDHEDSSGSVGFVLNKPLHKRVADYVSGLQTDFTIYEGGPVDQENLFYLHSRPDIISNSEPINDTLYWAGDFKDVQHAVNHQEISAGEIRFYLGYSGWSAHQLSEEIERKSWHLMQDPSFNIFESWDNNLWQQQMTLLGGENLIWLNMPENPMLN
ncbi:MAG: YqgE/AlgH family protein [Weeksellaceae bacterium]|nr:YqgE/AlgH family protein [Weeksellaceae bacterium]